MPRLLIANRGEIALRILRAADDLGWETVALHTEEEVDALHAQLATCAIGLPGTGPAPFLDAHGLVAIAREEGCTHLHPGYGLLSENAELADACAAAGVVFVGPSAVTLASFGDKTAARALALRTGLPCLEGTSGATSLEEAQAFFAELGPDAAVVVKALAGGGGRGMRVVAEETDLKRSFERCRSEARRAFGIDTVYVERFLARATSMRISSI
ncbi:MAG: biotin carboxylase N-terminal domain-containing protein [bacterium]